MPALSLSVVPFASFLDLVREASGGAADREAPDQVRYIQSYLRNAEAGARSIIVERPYIDRHWLEEYSGYYATVLESPTPTTVRLHFLREQHADDLIDRIVDRAAADPGDATQWLQSVYLGYMVVRPLPSAPVGRTVLRPYEGSGMRDYSPANVENRVHFAGLTLRVRGLPFQQQEQGAGACATAALWSALAKVMRTDGQRPITPLAITRSATEHRVSARALPANAGLDLDQMATAIRAAGYQPHVFRVAEESETFLLALKCYLASGIPVVVRVAVERGDYHALTLVGFRHSDDEMIAIRVKSRVLQSRAIERFYVHDDRFGPYARLEHRTGDDDDYELQLSPRERGYEAVAQVMKFGHAIVPLYPKLRLTAEELVEIAIELLPAVTLAAGTKASQLALEPSFRLGGDYIGLALKRPIDGARKRALATSALLSRYVGVLAFFLDGEWFCDVVCDTTDLRRDGLTPPPLLAVVPFEPAHTHMFESFRNALFGSRPLIL